MTNEDRPARRARSLREVTARWRDDLVVIAIAVVCSIVIFGLLYDAFDGALRRWTDRDFASRARLLGLAVGSSMRNASPSEIQGALDSVSRPAYPVDLSICAATGSHLAATGLGKNLGCGSVLAQAALRASGRPTRGTIQGRDVVVTAETIDSATTLFVLQDRSFLDARRRHLLQVLFFCAELGLVALLLLARAGWRIGERRTEEAARTLIRNMRDTPNDTPAVSPALRLLVRDVHDTVEQLRSRDFSELAGADKLRATIRTQVPEGALVVMANREPYAHEWDTEGRVVVNRPASGLVTGIEPMLRACGGTWIAYGGGSADRAHSGADGRVGVPPENPEYGLRRIWIDEAAYEGYYSGFANEGLWPLCHNAHTQPSFRPSDWNAYQAVNAAFARAAVEETASSESLLLIQDYHFALVPRLVRAQAPHVVTSIFWHIPWPNSEIVGICPRKEALLDGMVGADIVGFHTRQYCLNFLETAQRYLECRVDLEQMSVTYGGHRTLVRPYPISVEWPYPAATRTAGVALRESLGIPAGVHVSVGVDRADYTKGLLERVEAIECLLERNPSLAGNFVFVQLASPTRTKIRRYQQLAEDLTEAVARVNDRFGTPGWKPILLQMRTFSPEEVRQYYAMANSALVTPLHDGMNLVAKEYVASCDDNDGVLVLSIFAGAARELDGALRVNPYDTEQMAEAILRAIGMPIAERRARMQPMRDQIATNSIYDWSEKLLTDMRTLRLERARYWPYRRVAESRAAHDVLAG